MKSDDAADQHDDTTAVAIAKPKELIVDQSLSAVEIAALLAPVEALYGFWNNLSETLLGAAVDEGFNDPTLPAGRAQGRAGLQDAAKAFHQAVPDFRLEVQQRLVVGNRIVSHLRFTGHFTGQYQGTHGKGQAVDFIATDIIQVIDGKISGNWHLEDNLTFMKQIGFAQ